MNISHDCANVHHEERSNAISSAGVPNGGGLVKLRSSGAKRQWRLLSTDRIGDETSPVFLVTNYLCRLWRKVLLGKRRKNDGFYYF